jgi:drug/metabolite transporter (DMT)-like permease
VTLWIAVPCALLAAIAYGAATAVQHRAAQDTAEEGPRGLATLLRNPRWLIATGGDGVGLVLQVIALATGPVVLVQPLLVLALPVALPVGRLLGGPRPGRGDALAVAAIVAALAVFFVLVGSPAAAQPITGKAVAVAAAVCVAASVAVMVARSRSAWRAVALGTAAGVGFGLVGVLINAVSVEFDAHGVRGLLDGRAVTALVATVVVGAVAITATQLSFQVGSLGASFPANESAAPAAAVVLGALLLHERVPAGPPFLLAYTLCMAAVIGATVQLARIQT